MPSTHKGPRRLSARHKPPRSTRRVTCIIHTMLGNKLADCRIEKRWADGRSVWLGATNIIKDSQCWEVSPDSNPYDDLDRAVITVAGAAAEMMFDADHRRGSSLDEIVLFKMLVGNAATKLGLSLELADVWMWVNVGKMLRHYKDVHRAITEALLRKQTLGADDLAALVGRVVPIGKRVWSLYLDKETPPELKRPRVDAGAFDD